MFFEEIENALVLYYGFEVFNFNLEVSLMLLSQLNMTLYLSIAFFEHGFEKSLQLVLKFY